MNLQPQQPATPLVQPDKTHQILEYKHTRPLISCCWDSKSRYVFFGAEDNIIHRYEVASKNVVPLQAHDSWVRAMGVTPDGETVLTAGYDGRLVTWDMKDVSKAKRVVDAHIGWARALAISPDGKQVATCGNDQFVKLWDIAEGRLIREFSGHQSHVYYVAFTADGKQLLSCDLKGHLKLWSIEEPDRKTDVVKAEALTKYDTTFRADIGGARSMATNADGSILAMAGITNVSNAFAGVGEVAVVLVDWQKSKITQTLESKDKTRGTAWGVAYHPDGFWLAVTAGSGGWLYFWKGDIAHEFFKLKLKSDGRGMSLSPDNRQVAVAHADNHLRLYDMNA
ncbi:MAG: hypothetical protein IT423_16560 [Pirellulaceae bacterium]|nr:hypothetical protein [Pirellulaceae bacterium]